MSHPKLATETLPILSLRIIFAQLANTMACCQPWEPHATYSEMCTILYTLEKQSIVGSNLFFMQRTLSINLLRSYHWSQKTGCGGCDNKQPSLYRGDSIKQASKSLIGPGVLALDHFGRILLLIQNTIVMGDRRWKESWKAWIPILWFRDGKTEYQDLSFIHLAIHPHSKGIYWVATVCKVIYSGGLLRGIR